FAGPVSHRPGSKVPRNTCPSPFRRPPVSTRSLRVAPHYSTFLPAERDTRADVRADVPICAGQNGWWKVEGIGRRGAVATAARHLRDAPRGVSGPLGRCDRAHRGGKWRGGGSRRSPNRGRARRGVPYPSVMTATRPSTAAAGTARQLLDNLRPALRGGEQALRTAVAVFLAEGHPQI